MIAGILFLDYILLPSYVGYDNEHYLPDVRGYYSQKANYELNILGFKTETITIPFSDKHNPGTVIKMSPRSFTKVKEGRTITLTIAGHREDIIIPDYSNLSLRNATISANKIGLGIDTIMYEYSNSVKDGNISFQVPKPGQIVKSGSEISLGVSKGNPPDYYIVPNLIGKSLRTAKVEISKSGLRLGLIEYEFQPDLLKNTVIDQNFTPGLRVTFPAAIDIIISKEEDI